MDKGKWYAFTAAFLNALVGIFSLSLFHLGTNAQHIAFYKCITAVIVLSALMFVHRGYRKQIREIWRYRYQVAVMAFFGMFTLFYFETMAYQYQHIAVVVFTLLGASTVMAFFFSWLLLGQPLSPVMRYSLFCALAGLFIFAVQNHFSMNIGVLLAAIAGFGYGLFLVLNNKFSIPVTGVPLLWLLMIFGTLYLAIPFFAGSPNFPALNQIPAILFLGILPTIGGFYCTTQALRYAQATEVQIFELAEPVMASILGFLVYQQWLTLYEVFGGILILAAIRLANSKEKEQTICLVS